MTSKHHHLKTYFHCKKCAQVRSVEAIEGAQVLSGPRCPICKKEMRLMKVETGQQVQLDLFKDE